MSTGRKHSGTVTYSQEEEESWSLAATREEDLEEDRAVLDEPSAQLEYASGDGSISVTLIARLAPLTGARMSDPRGLGVIARRFNTLRHPLREVVNVPARASGPMRAARSPSARTFATEAFVVGGESKGTETWLIAQGATPIERRDDRTLFLAPPEADPVETAFRLAWAARQRGALYAHPTFIRQVARLDPGQSRLSRLWNHAAIGAHATWSLVNGRGVPEIKVAIIDEGVDIAHPALMGAVTANRDFIGGESTAMPSGNDAHGTACAGIVGSRSPTTPGLAPLVSLVAARIAKDDGTGLWVSDDFATADAIEWCWKDAMADVLSCSWGGGLPSDVIAEAFRQAQTRGRGGNGAVVIIAAGNDEGPIGFPGTIEGPIVVGALTAGNQRKTRSSNDNEPSWGSNHGATLSLLAPGVRIATTDISGKRGYTRKNFLDSFNGTSSAAPHVAAAAAIVLSIAPALPAVKVKEFITSTACKLAGQNGWTPTEGHGRLDLLAAATAATRAKKSPRKPAAKTAVDQPGTKLTEPKNKPKKPRRQRETQTTDKRAKAKNTKKPAKLAVKAAGVPKPTSKSRRSTRKIRRSAPDVVG